MIDTRNGEIPDRFVDFCKEVAPEPKYRKCSTCASKVELVDNYRKGWGTVDSYVEPCNTCANNDTPLDERPCYDCTHNQDN